MSGPWSARTSWSDERIERAKQLWAAGHSASQIAALLGGVSRNAVIGKLNRAGCRNRQRDFVPLKAAARDRQVVVRIARKPKETCAPLPTPEPVAVARSVPVPFLERRMHHQCAAILNDGPVEQLVCCGGPIPRESAYQFCVPHQRRYLTKPQPRSVA